MLPGQPRQSGNTCPPSHHTVWYKRCRCDAYIERTIQSMGGGAADMLQGCSLAYMGVDEYCVGVCVWVCVVCVFCVFCVLCSVLCALFVVMCRWIKW